MTKKVLKIDGMHCVSCTMLVDGDLEDLKGVKSSKTNFAKAQCEVEFEEAEVEIDEIVRTVKGTGYKVSKVQ